MDVKCCNCGEPWDKYGLLHDDGLICAINHEKHIQEGKIPEEYRTCRRGVFIFGSDDNFYADFYHGLTEVEHFLLLKCECCKAEPKCPECNSVLTLDQYENVNHNYQCKCGAVTFVKDTKYNPDRCTECGSPTRENEPVCFWCIANERNVRKGDYL